MNCEQNGVIKSTSLSIITQAKTSESLSKGQFCSSFSRMSFNIFELFPFTYLCFIFPKTVSNFTIALLSTDNVLKFSFTKISRNAFGSSNDIKSWSNVYISIFKLCILKYSLYSDLDKNVLHSLFIFGITIT